eukprot:5486145-Amphidinium_carterae.1
MQNLTFLSSFLSLLGESRGLYRPEQQSKNKRSNQTSFFVRGLVTPADKSDISFLEWFWLVDCLLSNPLDLR